LSAFGVWFHSMDVFLYWLSEFFFFKWVIL